MTTKSLKTWKGDRLKQNTYLQVIWEATQLPIRIRVTNNLWQDYFLLIPWIFETEKVLTEIFTLKLFKLVWDDPGGQL